YMLLYIKESQNVMEGLNVTWTSDNKDNTGGHHRDLHRSIYRLRKFTGDRNYYDFNFARYTYSVSSDFPDLFNRYGTCFCDCDHHIFNIWVSSMGIRSVFTYFYTGGLHHESPSSDRTDFSFGHALCHCRKCVLAVATQRCVNYGNW